MGREDLAETAIAQMLDIEAQLPVLEATIAETCRLTNLNVNSQIQHRNRNQPFLNINGNANFMISLKGDAAPE